MLRSILFHVLLASLVILCVPSMVSSASPRSKYPTYTLIVDDTFTPLTGQSLRDWMDYLQPRANVMGRVHFIRCPDGTVESVYPVCEEDTTPLYYALPTEEDTIIGIMYPTIS